jgi:hypothetical protein
VLGEFFFCGHDEIDESLVASGPDSGHPSVAANGLSPVDIARLGEILGVGTYRDVLDRTAQVHRESASGESGIYDVPDSLVTALLDTDDLAAVAGRWSETDELRLSGWNAAATGSVLAGLKALAAGRGAKPLWYWWSV